MDHPYPGLKYVPAKELDRSKVTFENYTVEDPAGEKLGKLEGFIIDVSQGLPYYLVVNAGGWFRSKHVLIPIGHVALDTESHKLIADVPKDRIKQFPGFDLDVLPTLKREELDRMAQDIVGVCCPDQVVAVEVWGHYRTPTWWDPNFYTQEQRDEAGSLKR